MNELFFISPRETSSNFINDEMVNIPVNIFCIKGIKKREVPTSGLKASNKVYMIDFVGTGISWEYDYPEVRDQMFAKLASNDFQPFIQSGYLL